ncbi:MAG: hypothetical protein P4K93_12730 [Terracidiphilus sp.]|nr:hypothetical protein [Terracidiphilus sp.]
MRSAINVAMFLCLLGVTAVPAQTQNSQPADPMKGMDMGTPAGSGQPATSGKPMDMSQCKMMMDSNGGKPMAMGNGSGMNMCQCMMMMHGAMHHGDTSPIPPGTLRASFGEQSKDWTAATLAALPHVTVTVHNEHTKADEIYSGVPLIALLAPMGVSEHPRGKDLRLYVVAEGSDGYEAVYASGEITPEVSSSTVIVADTENGKALAGDGPLKLIATGEKRPARWVRSLVAIKVFAAE